MLAPVQCKALDHPGGQRGLGGDLSLPDCDGYIQIGGGHLAGRDESRPGRGSHSLEQPLVPDPGGCKGPQEIVGLPGYGVPRKGRHTTRLGGRVPPAGYAERTSAGSAYP
ncbi:hypothetical protein GCM10010448_46990 [Streptomyces glomeratus]|uniref:Uncharacterized protein n=1 Tax=Streptomyces glomeratus TaxID=284452 RepID=A0ABP6LTF1_9ACTN